MAVRSGREAAVLLLLERGDSDLNARDLSGATPLELAVQSGYEGIVGLLKAAQTYYSGPTGAGSSTPTGY
ncbi:hypothetical protein L873DRAFT_1819888 [Choiromyces venosus 120613-1]|uniref:Uncharacterized protein n=1 Tax=Choiromyces venosus 120613-1 TaxID=1336337 RepID=A0A3N4IZ84_9PEZI|nr:hypothetical protein L873DRAFT_1819888 [Choiromyces venosus 120613-1]